MSQEHGFAVKRLQGHRKNALFASAAGSIAAVSGKACAVSDTAQRSRDKGRGRSMAQDFLYETGKLFVKQGGTYDKEI